MRRLARGEVTAAAIHVHRLDGDDEAANLDAVADAPGLHDVVVIAFARREQGLVLAPGNPLAVARHRRRRRAAGASGAAAARVPARSSSCLPFSPAPAWRSMRWHWSSRSVRPAPISPRRCAPAAPTAASRPASVAQAAGLDFVPLTWERFDLALRQRDYFLPGPQALFEFVRTAAFRDRAAELAGYDVSEAGDVRALN